jgi:shikimate kinase
LEADLDKIVIVGHRGAGKSSLLKRWKLYQPHFKFADLDEEIEKAEGQSVAQIFSANGENRFRDLEKEIWLNLQEKNIVTVGGGFNLDLISSNWKIFWVRRDSDNFDRVFLDRPTLPDYQARFEKRDASFEALASLVYTMPEGLFQADEEEKKILIGKFESVGGAVTLPKRNYPNTLIEVRDDLELKEYPSSDVLFSVRTGTKYPSLKKVDWDIKNPLPKGLKPFVISTHENSIEVLRPFEKSEVILKFCPEVNTWGELLFGIRWQNENPQKHVFLPRSQDGRWNWFRLWMKGRQPLNFWREGKGSALDQPTLWEWLSHPEKAMQFAAVMGNPVSQSYSPTYHKSFFLEKNIPFYKIQIEKEEWEQAIEILDRLGLIAAAVTAPLKVQAGKLIEQESLNTLWKENGFWRGANTDNLGAAALLQEFLKNSIVVWGGGGVLRSLKETIPQASYYSAQLGMPREGSFLIQDPEVLVWGDSHNSLDRIPENWKPKTVVSLSYHDKSPARGYALKVGAQYVSGLKMFEAQAQEQQKHWVKAISI